MDYIEWPDYDRGRFGYYLKQKYNEYWSAYTQKGIHCNEARKLKALVKSFEGENLDIDCDDVDPNYLLERSSENKSAELTFYRTVIGEIYRSAINDGGCSIDRSKELAVSRSKKESNLITDKEFKAVLSTLKENRFGYIIGMIIYLDISINEFNNIKRADCDDSLYMVTGFQNNRLRKIYEPDGRQFMDKAVRVFDERMADELYACTNREKILCANRYGDKYSETDITDLFKYIQAESDCTNVNLESLKRYIRYNRL